MHESGKMTGKQLSMRKDMSNCKINRKAQITVFIIIGVIVLFSTATILVIKDQLDEGKISTEKEPVIKEVPAQLKVVQQFVDECIKRSAVEGLTLLGQQSGFIDIDAEAFREVDMHPTESDYVRMFDTKVPYWHYLKSRNPALDACLMSSNKPRLRKSGTAKTPFYSKQQQADKDPIVIEAQLESFVNSQLDNCLGSFGELEERGYNVAKSGSIKSKVTVAEQEVRFLVQLPLKVTYQQSITDLNEFYVKVPLQLKKIYEVAETIMQAQVEYKFLSRTAMDLIGTYSGLRSSDLMPTSEMTFESGASKFFIQTQMKDKIEQIFSAWLPAIQVQDTANYKPLTVNEDVRFKPPIRRMYDNLIIPELPDVIGYEKLGIYFNYLDWPIYLNMANCAGQLCKPDTMKNKFLPLPFEVQNYDAQYDVSFPIVVEIKHPETNDFKDGYIFRFALEDNIRTNQHFDCGTVILEVPSDDSSETLLCNPNQRISKEYTFEITDAVTGQGIPDVSIEADVASDVCTLGNTDDKGRYSGSLPLALGAKISAEKNNYITKSVIKNIDRGNAEQISIELAPIKEVEVDVKKHFMGFKYDKPKTSVGSVFKDIKGIVGGYFRFAIFADTKSIRDEVKSAIAQGMMRTGPMIAIAKDINLSSTDEVMVQFTRKSDDQLEDDFTTILHFVPNSTKLQKMRLAPGKYEITGQLVVHDTRIVPSTTKKVRTKPWKSKKNINIPGTELDDPHIWGGIELKDMVIRNSLMRENKITFKVIELPIPQSIEDMNWMSDIGGISQQQRLILEPK